MAPSGDASGATTAGVDSTAPSGDASGAATAKVGWAASSGDPPSPPRLRAMTLGDLLGLAVPPPPSPPPLSALASLPVVPLPPLRPDRPPLPGLRSPLDAGLLLVGASSAASSGFLAARLALGAAAAGGRPVLIAREADLSRLAPRGAPSDAGGAARGASSPSLSVWSRVRTRSVSGGREALAYLASLHLLPPDRRPTLLVLIGLSSLGADMESARAAERARAKGRGGAARRGAEAGLGAGEAGGRGGSRGGPLAVPGPPPPPPSPAPGPPPPLPSAAPRVGAGACRLAAALCDAGAFLAREAVREERRASECGDRAAAPLPPPPSLPFPLAVAALDLPPAAPLPLAPLSPLRRWFSRAIAAAPLPPSKDRLLLFSPWGDDVAAGGGEAWRSVRVRARPGGPVEGIDGWERAEEERA